MAAGRIEAGNLGLEQQAIARPIVWFTPGQTFDPCVGSQLESGWHEIIPIVLARPSSVNIRCLVVGVVILTAGVEGSGRRDWPVTLRCPLQSAPLPIASFLAFWWRGGPNGTLMLLLAHLLVRNPVWRNRHIRVLSAIPAEKDPGKAADLIREMLATARIKAEP